MRSKKRAVAASWAAHLSHPGALIQWLVLLMQFGHAMFPTRRRQFQAVRVLGAPQPHAHAGKLPLLLLLPLSPPVLLFVWLLLLPTHPQLLQRAQLLVPLPPHLYEPCCTMPIIPCSRRSRCWTPSTACCAPGPAYPCHSIAVLSLLCPQTPAVGGHAAGYLGLHVICAHTPEG